ncbi:unnamed protein product (macronuclear) [Paramecium tetraurelia]|uniref:EF-hand domain-containing protein n=1 Tax=Paramecium tetraurelia TaxID=5888 RepID=A0DNJ6_PARTE|nr:uncharacterized protein GSPATT00018809001 [Paramecium tetraurelia]CAK84613.1 unnamed protein product [Paramecium tetraurelia]|eukprot:XP_001452010.1 hypothetical protein (macronuclear) [Paramecium tetraurelia strain d4-2]
MKSYSPVLNQSKGTTTGFLKKLLDYKVNLNSNRSSKIQSISSFQRDISHLADSFRHKTLQQQIKEKQQIAEMRLSEYILKQKERKHNQQYMIQSQRYYYKTQNLENTFDDVLQILEKYSDFNLNWVAQDLQEVSGNRKNAMLNLKTTIENGLEKGYFEDISSIQNAERQLSIKKKIHMKHTSTHFFSSEPTGRNDAINLKKWLQNQLESISQNPSIDHKSKLQQASDVLFICLNELIRQVSFQCTERGQLMLAIFKGYIKVFRKTINMSESDKQQMQIKGYKSQLEQQVEFEQQQDDLNEKILDLKKVIQQQEKKLKTQQDDEQNLIAIVQKLTKQNELDKSMKKGAATLISNLNREIKELRNKISKIQYMKQSGFQVVQVEEDVDEQDLSLSQVLKEVEQKTCVEQNPDIVVKDIVDEPPKITFSVNCQTEIPTRTFETQTDLNLIGHQYDKIINQQELDQHFKEYQLKEQMGFFLQEDQPQSSNNKNVQSHLQMQQTKEQRSSLIRILDGLPGSMDHIRNMKKEDMFDLFANNMKTLRDLFDKEEPQEKQIQSDSEQSMFVEPPEVNSDEKRSTHKDSKNNIKLIAEVAEMEEASPMPTSQKRINFSLKKLSFEKIEVQSVKNNTNTNSSKQNQKSNKRQLEKMFSSEKLALPTVKEFQPNELNQTQMLTNSNLNIVNSNSSVIQSSQNLQANSIANKFGLSKQEQIQLKTQVAMLIMLYNLQIQKSQNLTKSMNDFAGLLNQLFSFTRKLMIHILRTQQQSHKQIAEQFLVEFDSLRKRMPVELDAEIQEEEYIINELDEEEEKEKKKQIQFKRKKNRITKALQFNFQTKQNKVNVIDRLMHPGVILAVKAREQSYLFKKVVNYWPLKNVLRTITQLYDEKVRSSKEYETQKDLEMQIFVFNNFLNRYGFKNVAEKKYLQFLLSVIHFSSIFRVNVFARMIAILQDEHLNFSIEESSFFLQGYDFMCSESTLGVNVVQSESEQKFHVPYLRALDYMKVYLENKMMEDELRDLKNDLENLKEPDPKNLNKQGLIDVDNFLIKVMNKYRIITIRTKEFVIHAFQAADLDGNKKINNNEFITLFRHIEHQKFNFKEAMNLFYEQADIISVDERSLSFNRFTSVCVSQQIFTFQALNHFINVRTNDDVEKQFLQVRQEWQNYKLEIESTLKELQPYVTPEIFSEWNTIIKTLEQRIMSQTNQHSSIKPILIAHKILKLELKRLLNVGHQEDDIDENAVIL